MTDTTDLLQNVRDDDRWLRRMARRLLRDPHAADDAAQEAWLAALRAGEPRSRGWFATVVKNAALQLRRGESARTRRELAVARGEASADPAASIVERLATQRRVLDAVLALPESARTVVLLRFFENLPPRAIADRLGEPVATVKTRLHRALERLRVDLDQAHGGDRRAWMIALVPFATPSAASGAVTGGVVMALSAKWIALPAAIVVITGVGMFMQGDPARNVEPTPPVVKAPAAAIGGAEDDSASVAQKRVDTGVSPTRAAAPAESTPPSIPTATTRIARGLVVDLSGAPRAQLPLRLTSEGRVVREIEATSDAAGRFEFDDAPEYGSVWSADPTIATVFAGIVGVSNTIEPTVVVAPAIRITGLVIDGDGAPIPHVTIEVEARRVVEASIARPLDSTRPVVVSAESDANGRFELEHVPAVPRAKLVAKCDGFANAVQPLPTEGGEVRFVLTRLVAQQNHLVGQIVDRFQIPIDGASIALLGAGAKSGADGRFVIATDDVSSAKRLAVAVELRVAKSGFLPTTVALDPDHLPPTVLVVLDGESKTIEGFVRTQNGDPLRGVIVTVADGTPFGIVDDQVSFAEEIAQRGPSMTGTDASGHFEVSGLADREYVLQLIVSDEPVLVVRCAPIKAGSQGVTLIVPDDARVDEIRGVVVGPNGEPLAGVTVAPQVVTREIQVFSSGSVERAAGKSVVTDEMGCFVLRNVARRGLWLCVSGDLVIEDQAEIPDITDPPAAITLTARRRCHFRIELTGDDAAARSASAFDAAGNQIAIGTIRSNQSSWSHGVMLDGGKSGVLVLPETATKLVLRFPDTHEKELPLHLVPGEVIVVNG